MTLHGRVRQFASTDPDLTFFVRPGQTDASVGSALAAYDAVGTGWHQDIYADQRG